MMRGNELARTVLGSEHAVFSAKKIDIFLWKNEFLTHKSAQGQGWEQPGVVEGVTEGQGWNKISFKLPPKPNFVFLLIKI